VPRNAIDKEAWISLSGDLLQKRFDFRTQFAHRDLNGFRVAKDGLHRRTSLLRCYDRGAQFEFTLGAIAQKTYVGS